MLIEGPMRPGTPDVHPHSVEGALGGVVQTVNAHVFFWVDRESVDRLLGARAYRNDRHALLGARTQDILDRHSRLAVLSPPGCADWRLPITWRDPDGLLDLA
jgi:hypothetical protein